MAAFETTSTGSPTGRSHSNGSAGSIRGHGVASSSTARSSSFASGGEPRRALHSDEAIGDGSAVSGRDPDRRPERVERGERDPGKWDWPDLNWRLGVPNPEGWTKLPHSPTIRGQKHRSRAAHTGIRELPSERQGTHRCPPQTPRREHLV